MNIEDLRRRLKAAQEVATKGVKEGARTIRKGAKAAKSHQGRMEDGIAAVIEAGARKTERAADNAAVHPSVNKSETSTRIASTVPGAVRVATGAIRQSAEATAAAIAGAAVGAIVMVNETIDGVVVTESDIADARQELECYGETLQRRGATQAKVIESAIKGRRKKELIDHLVIGGVTLGVILNDPAQTPEMVEEAFRHAYPDLAVNESFADAVDRLSSSELIGLVSGVKGKLFELEFVDYLNAGNLPDGHWASIAESATQSGWDLKITDAQGEVASFLQAKATDSVGYVQEALSRYPDIDVTTTSEVYAQLLALGMAENVIDSGIAVAALESAVSDAAVSADSVFSASDLVPSTLGLAIIALTVYMDKSLSLKQKGAAMGERSAKVGVASGAGAAVMVVTQLWVLALVAGVGTSVLATKGGRKRERLQILEDALDELRGMKRLSSPPPRRKWLLAHGV